MPSAPPVVNLPEPYAPPRREHTVNRIIDRIRVHHHRHHPRQDILHNNIQQPIAANNAANMRSYPPESNGYANFPTMPMTAAHIHQHVHPTSAATPFIKKTVNITRVMNPENAHEIVIPGPPPAFFRQDAKMVSQGAQSHGMMVPPFRGLLPHSPNSPNMQYPVTPVPHHVQRNVNPLFAAVTPATAFPPPTVDTGLLPAPPVPDMLQEHSPLLPHEARDKEVDEALDLLSPATVADDSDATSFGQTERNAGTRPITITPTALPSSDLPTTPTNMDSMNSSSSNQSGLHADHLPPVRTKNADTVEIPTITTFAMDSVSTNSDETRDLYDGTRADFAATYPLPVTVGRRPSWNSEVASDTADAL